MAPAECRFAYRTSVFKYNDRYVVLSTDFSLAASPLSAPIRYDELARMLGVELGARVPRARAADAGVPPAYPAEDGGVKVSAAWLIDRAGFVKGYGHPGTGVAISGKHTLALTNRGTGSTAALLDLAREIQAGVSARFGLTLHPEPVLVSCAL